MDRRGYLDRIGFDDPLAVDVETLSALHVAHLRAVPFENLDVHRGQPILLDEVRFYDKIVTRRRGGYCYELNGLFARLLADIGFDVTLLSAGVYDAAADRYGPDGDHLCLLVTLDEPWLADVGFGASFSEPMRIEDGFERTERQTTFRLTLEADDGWILWSRSPEETWSPEYRFTLRKRRLFDFTYANHYMQTSPDSTFTRKRVCTRATVEGRVTLSDQRLITSTDGERHEREIDPRSEAALLRDLFGIVLD